MEAIIVMGFLDIACGWIRGMWDSTETILGKLQKHHTQQLINTNLELEKD